MNSPKTPSDIEDLSVLLDSQCRTPPDLRFKVQGPEDTLETTKQFLAHKSVLALASPVLKSQLSRPEDMEDAVIVVDDVLAEVFYTFLRLLYRPSDLHKSNLSVLHLLHLSLLAEKHKVSWLKSAILQKIQSLIIDQHNILEIISALGNIQVEAAVLLQSRVEDFLVQNLKSGQDLVHTLLMHVTSEGSLSIPLLSILNIARKTVRFNSEVEQRVFDVNSAILAKTAKNKKKAEKKRRSREKRNSECDCIDSSCASSFEESMVESVVHHDISGNLTVQIPEHTDFTVTPNEDIFSMEF